MNFIKNIFYFIILLSVIISIHELGHLIAAKLFGVYCKEYAIGMGPKIWSFMGKETEYSIRAIPMGGFVSMAGDQDSMLESNVEEEVPFERALNGIAKWKRIIVMLAGIMMNMVLAIFIYSMVILSSGYYVKSTKPVITTIKENSPAEKAGLKKGDIVNTIAFENGMSVKPDTYFELITFTSTYDGEGEWTITVERESKKITINVEPEYDEENERYVVGMGFADSAIDIVEVNILNCFYYGFQYTMMILKLTISAFGSLLKGKNLETLSGPIGIYNTVAETTALGLDYYIQLIAMISVNLALVNILPLPVLDGGRVLLLIIEIIIGKPLSEKAQTLIMNISVAILLALLLFVTYNDISKLIGG